jgi:hypothetical protein
MLVIRQRKPVVCHDDLNVGEMVLESSAFRSTQPPNNNTIDFVQVKARSAGSEALPHSSVGDAETTVRVERNWNSTRFAIKRTVFWDKYEVIPTSFWATVENPMHGYKIAPRLDSTDSFGNRDRKTIQRPKRHCSPFWPSPNEKATKWSCRCEQGK